MMNKYVLILMLFIGCISGCSKDDQSGSSVELTEEKQFRTTLMSKNWLITKYEYRDEQNDQFPIRDFYNDSIYTSKRNIEPDPCDWSGTKTSPMGIWKTYEVKFTESSFSGSFSYNMRKVDWDTTVTNTSGCKIGYETTNHNDNITSNWSYDHAAKTLTANFGEPYEILDGQPEYFEIKYHVVSFNAHKIVLEGKRDFEGEPFLTNNITLE